jgi:hypothetical protein
MHLLSQRFLDTVTTLIKAEQIKLILDFSQKNKKKRYSDVVEVSRPRLLLKGQ